MDKFIWYENCGNAASRLEEKTPKQSLVDKIKTMFDNIYAVCKSLE